MDSPDEQNVPDPLRNFLRGQRQLEETFRRIAESMGPVQRQIEETFKRIADPTSPIRKALLGFAEHQRHIEQTLAQNLSRVLEQQRHFESTFQQTFVRIAEQARQFEETFHRLNDPTGPIAAVLRNFAEEEKKVRNLFSAALTRIPLNTSIGNIAAVSLKLDTISRDISQASFEVTSDARIRSTDSSIPIQDAILRLEEFISKSKALSEVAKGQHELGTIDLIYDEIKKQNSPVRIILFQILLQILIGYFINLTTPYVDETIRPIFNTREIVKQLQSEAKTLGLQQNELREIRIVVASSLNVREASTINSRIIGMLYHGQVVRHVENDRDWTLVEFTDGDITVRGWSFTRYLKRFPRRPILIRKKRKK